MKTKTIDIHWMQWIIGLVITMSLLLHSDAALAGTTTGGGLPMDSWFTTIRQSIEGPFAYTVSIVGIIGAGAGLIFGGEMNGFLRILIFIVLVLSFVVAADNSIRAITGQGAEISSHVSHNLHLKEGV